MQMGEAVRKLRDGVLMGPSTHSHKIPSLGAMGNTGEWLSCTGKLLWNTKSPATPQQQCLRLCQRLVCSLKGEILTPPGP